MNKKLQTGFIFTNFNNSSITRQAVESLNKINAEDRIKIVIIDNNSVEEDIAQLKALNGDYPNIHIIYSNENLGYFKGLNLGIKYIQQNETEWDCLIVGNNDLIFPGDFLEKLSDIPEIINAYPVISPDIITLDKEHQNPHVVSKISRVREFIYDVYYFNYNLALLIKYLARKTHSFTDRTDEQQYNIAQTIYQGYGACYILTPMFFKHFKELWAPTFLMGEELFLSKQLESKGFKTYYEPSIEVIHQCHSTMSKLPSKKLWRIGRDAHKEYRKFVKVL